MAEGVHHDGLVIGVDVGGSKVAAGVVDRDGRILSQVRAAMAASGQAAEGLAAVTSVIDKLLNSNPETRNTIHGIGICSPGPLDPKTGVVINPPNLPCWRNYPLATETARIYQLPVSVDNDGNAAALAEARWGAGYGYRNVFYTTIGTGIGAGMVFDGQLYHGRTGAAGEGGHMSIDYRGPECGCGKRGCIEILASGPAIARRARARLAQETPPTSAIWDLAGGSLDAVTSEIVGQANAMGDSSAHSILLETIELLSAWLGNIVDLLEPDIVVIGGGVASTLNPFFADMQAGLPRFCVNSRSCEIPVLPACYGENAGVAGGAALCSQVQLGAQVS